MLSSFWKSGARNWRRHYAKQVPKNLKGKSVSSQQWLTRQLSDPYVEKARMQNFRCRSAFKLLQIDDKYHILHPGAVVVDVGAAPGSWTQIAVDRTNANGKTAAAKKGEVFSIDLQHFAAVEGATTFGGMDFTDSKSQLRLKAALADRQVNCMLSDMAPNATGVRMLDQENIANLCYAVLKFAVTMSASNASLVVKVWDSGFVPKLEKDMLLSYASVKRVKPPSSRSDSAEYFLVARGYKNKS